MLIRNLPDNFEEARLIEALGGADRVGKIEYQDDPNPNTSQQQAIVTLEMDTYEAEQLAKRYHGMIFGGRPLRLTVMHLMD
jgi:hypothetical protein